MPLREGLDRLRSRERSGNRFPPHGLVALAKHLLRVVAVYREKELRRSLPQLPRVFHGEYRRIVCFYDIARARGIHNLSEVAPSPENPFPGFDSVKTDPK